MHNETASKGLMFSQVHSVIDTFDVSTEFKKPCTDPSIWQHKSDGTKMQNHLCVSKSREIIASFHHSKQQVHSLQSFQICAFIDIKSLRKV